MADLDVQRSGTNMWAWIIGIILAVVLIWVLFAAVGGADRQVGAPDEGETYGQQTPGEIQEPGTGLYGEEQRGGGVAGATGDTLWDDRTGNGVLEDEGEGMAGTPGATTQEGQAEITDEVAEFRAFALQDPTQVEIGSEHEFTGDGLEHLASALNSLADEVDVNDGAFEALTAQLGENADQLRNEETSEQHAMVIQQSFTAAAQALERLQAQAGSQPDADQIEQLRQAAMEIQPNELLLNQREQVMGAFQQASESLTSFNQNLMRTGAGAS